MNNSFVHYQIDFFQRIRWKGCQRKTRHSYNKALRSQSCSKTSQISRIWAKFWNSLITPTQKLGDVQFNSCVLVELKKISKNSGQGRCNSQKIKTQLFVSKSCIICATVRHLIWRIKLPQRWIFSTMTRIRRSGGRHIRSLGRIWGLGNGIFYDSIGFYW